MVMKKIIIFGVFFCLFSSMQNVFALDYSKISTNTKIVNALNALDTIKRRDVIAILYGRNATKQPIRVMFRNLTMYGAQDCEAITTKTKSNGLVIYINSEHKNASAECIACLIAHEAQHHTLTNTKTEELRAWISEAQAWNEFVKRNKALASSSEPLAKRENYIAKIKSNTGTIGIQKLIANNPVYANLN